MGIQDRNKGHILTYNRHESASYSHWLLFSLLSIDESSRSIQKGLLPGVTNLKDDEVQ
jgi:hypothetical protein